MGKKSNLVRIKVDFERFPIFDSTQRVKDEEDFDDIISNIKLKLFGK